MIDIAELAEQAVREHQATQKADELAWLGGLLAAESVRGVLEIGTYAGGTLWFLSQLADGPFVAIDATSDRFQCEDGTLIVGDSRSPYVRIQAFAHGPFDLVFIDADHAYEAVRADWEAYRPLARRFVAFHDICEHAPGTGCEVAKLWDEIKAAGYETTEIICDPATWGGIGIASVAHG